MKSRKERKKGETSSGAKYAAVVVVVATFGFATLLVLSGRGAAGGRRGVPSALTAGSARGFNVLMITLDTTRADRLGCYGHEGAATPHLDNLARDGVLFADAVTVAPVTLPSHSSIFTGLYPPNHGVRDNGEFKLADEHVTLAEILQGTGYETAAFVSAFVLDARFGLDQGFDVYDDAQELRDSATLAETVIERSASSVTDAAVGWGSTEYIVLRPKGAIPPLFAYLLARTDEFRTFAIQQMTGSSGRQRVPASSLDKYGVVTPDIDSPLYKHFGNLVSPMFNRIEVALKQSRVLAALRDALLPKLISGELRVPDAERIAGRCA